MNPVPFMKPRLTAWVAVIFPLGLWLMVWLGLQSGELRGILHPGNSPEFRDGVRSVLPLAAGSVALLFVFTRLYRERFQGPALYGPLGLMAVYGLVGVVATVFSPKWSVSLYQVGVYLSVPLVLWFTGWGTNSADRVGRIINLNWLMIGGLVTVLFVAALFTLDLGGVILNPSRWLDCDLNGPWLHNSWNFFSSFPVADGLLRPTGVGRMAAIVGIIALAGALRGRWRLLWAVPLVGSVFLLLTSSARTALVGFLVAAIFVTFLYGGKRAVLAWGVGLILIVPLAWGTGTGENFVANCILHTDNITIPTAPQQDPAPDQPV